MHLFWSYCIGINSSFCIISGMLYAVYGCYWLNDVVLVLLYCYELLDSHIMYLYVRGKRLLPCPTLQKQRSL